MWWNRFTMFLGKAFANTDIVPTPPARSIGKVIESSPDIT